MGCVLVWWVVAGGGVYEWGMNGGRVLWCLGIGEGSVWSWRMRLLVGRGRGACDWEGA